MIRNVFIFLGTFAAGAALALLARAAMFNPHNERSGSANDHPEYAAMVSNALVPAEAAPQAADASNSASHEHAAPAQPAAETKPGAARSEPASATGESRTATKASLAPVNTICAICGMPVDPTLPTLEYQGKRIGFGCKLCPPKFKADPDRYGPYYLRDERVKK